MNSPAEGTQLQEALKGLEPASIWEYFNQLTQIPRASEHEEAAIKYMERWAQQNGFECKNDGSNICIKVPGTPGRQHQPSVCLQGHIDMVAAKTDDSKHDFNKDPITVVRDGEYLKADNTTLGADNGIGLAGAMAVATDPEAIHPPLELLITTGEENGFIGTSQLDYKKLEMTSPTFINLDHEEIGTTGIQSAGLKMETGVRNLSRDQFKPKEPGSYYKFKIFNLPGGHSAKNIADGTPNAIKAMAKILQPMENSIRLVSINGGERVNGIPMQCEAVIFVPQSEGPAFIARGIQLQAMEIVEGRKGQVEIEELNPEEITCANMTAETHEAILTALNGIKSGAEKMHPDFKIPYTSQNLGTVKTEGSHVKIGFSMRSPDESELNRVHVETVDVLSGQNFSVKTDLQIPTWNADPNSRVVIAARNAYEDVTNKPATLGATHGGLEPSVIVNGLSQHLGKPVESVAFGPEIHKPHGPSEEVDIKSVGIFYEQLKRTLELLTME